MCRKCENLTTNLTLKYLRPGVKIDSKYVHIDPLFLFTRLSAIRQGETDSVKNLITNSRRNQYLSSRGYHAKASKDRVTKCIVR